MPYYTLKITGWFAGARANRLGKNLAHSIHDEYFSGCTLHRSFQPPYPNGEQTKTYRCGRDDHRFSVEIVYGVQFTAADISVHLVGAQQGIEKLLQEKGFRSQNSA